jgi:predicted transcriptional regulator YdeE
MQMRIVDRNAITLCGLTVETSLETCENDLGDLWSDFKERGLDNILNTVPECKNGIYGLMWYTEHHRYCYLLGVETEAEPTEPGSPTVKRIPPARYAVVGVPDGMSLIEAWTEFFEETLPKAGYAPDSEHGFYFEYYRSIDSSSCELWAPVRELP